MGVTLAAVLFLALAMVGCGDSPEPDEQASPEEQVAGVANAWQAAIDEADAGEACSYLSPRGQRIFLRLVVSDLDAEATTCEEAAASYAEFAARRSSATGREVTVDVFSPEDVLIEGGYADANCERRGAFQLELTDGEWLLVIPGCVD